MFHKPIPLYQQNNMRSRIRSQAFINTNGLTKITCIALTGYTHRLRGHTIRVKSSITSSSLYYTVTTGITGYRLTRIYTFTRRTPVQIIQISIQTCVQTDGVWTIYFNKQRNTTLIINILINLHQFVSYMNEYTLRLQVYSCRTKLYPYY